MPLLITLDYQESAHTLLITRASCSVSNDWNERRNTSTTIKRAAGEMQQNYCHSQQRWIWWRCSFDISIHTVFSPLNMSLLHAAHDAIYYLLEFVVLTWAVSAKKYILIPCLCMVVKKYNTDCWEKRKYRRPSLGGCFLNIRLGTWTGQLVLRSWRSMLVLPWTGANADWLYTLW